MIFDGILHHAFSSSCHFVHPKESLKTHGKKVSSIVEFMDANQWEIPQEWFKTYYCVFPQGKCLCGSMAGKLARPSGTLTCCESYFLDCEPDHMGRPAMFISAMVHGVKSLRLQRPALLHTGIPWKHRFILIHSGKLTRHRGCTVKLVFFPHVVGGAKIVFCCQWSRCKDKTFQITPNFPSFTILFKVDAFTHHDCIRFSAYVWWQK